MQCHPSETHSDAATSAAGSGCGREVLVVDDDPDVRELVGHVLRLHGCTVATAPDGRAALAWLEANAAPCLILLDLQMPVMDGRQLLAALARRPAFAAVPVLIASSDPPRGVVEQLGAAGLVPKPFGIAEVLAAVARHCPAGPGAGERDR